MSDTNGALKQNLAQAWKRKTETVTFPSGGQVEMTRPDALSLMAESDEIPDSFFNLMIEAQQGGKNPTEDMDAKQLREFFKTIGFLAKQLAVRHFVNPQVVVGREADEDELSLEDIEAMDMQDKQFLLNWGMYGGSPVELLTRFRAEQAKLMAAAQNGKSLPQDSL